MSDSSSAENDSQARLASLLDDWLQALEQGREADQIRLLQENPGIAAWVECLRSLNDFATLLTPDEEVPNLVATPTPFGPFELRQELGRGGMGIVFQAYQPSLDRSLALKMLTAGASLTAEQRRRFIQEARLLARLRHPHVVAIHEVGELQGQPYFTMDLIAGQSLTVRIRQHPLLPAHSVELMVQIASAVEYLHAQGILHRDLKPSNILLDAANHPVLVDFGLSRMMDEFQEPTLSGTVLGTPSYMSPEQAAGRVRDIDSRSDVYSLGAVLYEMLCGHPPFVGDSQLETVLLVLERDPPPLRSWNPAIPRELEQICLKCLEKSPDRRYQSVREFADDLNRWQRGEAPRAMSRTPWDYLRHACLGHPAGAYRLLSILPVIMVILGRCWTIPDLWDFYLPVLASLSVWSGLSLLWEFLMHVSHPVPKPATSDEAQPPTVSRRPFDWAPFAFVATDIVMLTITLHYARGLESPFIAAYILIVLMASLSLDPRLIWTAGGGSLLAYAAINLVAGPPSSWHIPLIVGILILSCTAVTSYQARRFSLWTRNRGSSAPKS